MRILFTCRPAYGHFFPLVPLASAARDAGHEVVFGTGEAFPDKVRGLGFEAHHVGIAAGLPQGADQFVNAEALSALGAAKSLVGAEITADAIEAGAPRRSLRARHRAARVR